MNKHNSSNNNNKHNSSNNNNKYNSNSSSSSNNNNNNNNNNNDDDDDDEWEILQNVNDGGIRLLAYNINKMTLELSTLKNEIEKYRLINQEQHRINALHYALKNADINSFYYFRTIDDIYLHKDRVCSSTLVREIIQVFIQGNGYNIGGYYLDEQTENEIRTKIPFFSTQRELLSIIKRNRHSKVIENAQLSFIENITDQIHILTGTYPKIDIKKNQTADLTDDITIWEY